MFPQIHEPQIFPLIPNLSIKLSSFMSSPSSPKRPCGAPIRNWTELPEDVTAAILSRLGAIDILETAQKVCKTWYKVCKDPLMWRIVDFRDDDLHKVHDLGKMCRYAVDRSDGKLASINLDSFATDELLKYITDRYCFNCSEMFDELEFSCVMFECKVMFFFCFFWDCSKVG